MSNRRMLDVLGVGHALVDVISPCDESFLDHHGFAKGMMRLIDSDEAERLYETLPEKKVESSGGSVANTIAGLASFGGCGGFVGRVYRDRLGDIFSKDMHAQSIDYCTPKAQTGLSTGRSMILVTRDGERTMNTYLGASAQLCRSDIDGDQIARSSVIYFEGYLWDSPSAYEAVCSMAKIAHTHGRKNALSLSDPLCVDRHRESLFVFVRDYVDILFANEMELMSLYEARHFDEALHHARKGCSLVVATRSSAGCVIARGGDVHVIEAEKVSVVDATGAGDLFASGFLYGYQRGEDLSLCGMLGTLSASEVITHMGARPQVNLGELAHSRGLI